MSPKPPVSAPAPSWQPLPALAGWLVPGLGHVVLGEWQRGLVVGGGILGIWLLGLLIGGISVIDRSEYTAWFYGQALMAPSLAVEFLRKRLYLAPFEPAAHPAYSLSFGRVNEMGVLFTALAGLMNLLAVLDVIYTDPRHRHDSAPAETEGGAA